MSDGGAVVLHNQSHCHTAATVVPMVVTCMDYTCSGWFTRCACRERI